MTKDRKKAYFLMLVTILIWGIALVVIKNTLSYVSPINFLFWRLLITSWIFFPFFIYQFNKNPLSFTEVVKLGLWGMLGTSIPLLLLFEGLARTTAIDTALIAVVGPLLVIIGGALLLKEKVEKHEKIGILLALIGTIVTIIQPFLEHQKTAGENILGNALVLASCFIGAAYILFAKNDLKKHSPFMVTSIAFFGGLVSLLPIFYYYNIDAISMIPVNEAWFGILYMAIFSSVIAYTTRANALKLIEASEVAVFSYLQPLIAIPLSVLLLHEVVTLPFLIGAGLIAIGVCIAEFAKRGKTKLLKD